VAALPILMCQFIALPSFHISSVSTCAGVAATAGELAKNQKHQDSGGDRV